MLEKYTFEEIRNISKKNFESLEIWLRNIIDYQLSKNYGNDYFNHIHENQNRLIKKKIVENSENKLRFEPDRYKRLIDTTFFDDIIEIICNPTLYNENFKEPLNDVFPVGREQAKFTLEKIKEVRNYLSHSNHINNRQSEQLNCYSKDIIDSIKLFYKKMNLEKEYNVPSIINFSDSFGNVLFANQYENSFIDLSKTDIYVGDSISMEVKIDESFNEEDYEIKWLFKNGESIFDLKDTRGKQLTIILENKNINENFIIECYVKSKEDWHRYGKHDDILKIRYKIKPR